MTDPNRVDQLQQESHIPVQPVKIVAEMPNDEEMRETLNETKANDGYPDSCGI